MTVVLFIVILVVLIVAHEFGHYVAAKMAKMKVEEFGLGYPPRALVLGRRAGTEYTLNWLPFGGFVKIKGEDGDEQSADSFGAKPRYQQALVLVAGIAMNFIVAWVLISATLALGMPRALEESELSKAEDAQLVVARVVEGSPAARAGFVSEDVILSATEGSREFTGLSATGFTEFVAASTGEVLFLVRRADSDVTLTATPTDGVVVADPTRVALGVGIVAIGTVPVPIYAAPVEGAVLTVEATKQVAVGLVSFFAGVFTLTADLGQVSGPIGIAGAVGDAAGNGLAALLTLTALISINLALVNLLPVPALDGGRLLFVLIEAIIRRPLPASVAGAVNAAGFAFLILLMVVVTASDLLKLF